MLNIEFCVWLLSTDYVCVLDLDWFELTLRLCNTAQFEEESQKVFTLTSQHSFSHLSLSLTHTIMHAHTSKPILSLFLSLTHTHTLSQQLFSHLPELSLECSSNILQIHTCVDSCVALRDLLVYLASDGDLRAHQAEDSRSSDLATGDDNSVRVAPHSSTSLPSSTSLDVDDLMTDAMEDSSVATPTPPSSVKPVSSGLIPPTASTGHDRVSSKSKMQVHTYICTYIHIHVLYTQFTHATHTHTHTQTQTHKCMHRHTAMFLMLFCKIT